MPEDLSYQHLDTEPPEEQAVTYQTLLADRATHDGLRPHLQRLAANETGLATLDQPRAADLSYGQPPVEPQPNDAYPDGIQQAREDRSSEARSGLPGLAEMTVGLQGWSAAISEGHPAGEGAGLFEPDLSEYEILESGEYSEQDLAGYIREARVLCDVLEDAAARRGEPAIGNRYEGIMAALTNVPLDKMRAVYQSAELSADLRYMLESVEDAYYIRDAFTFVQRMHGGQDILDLWEQGSPAFDDLTFQELVYKDESMDAITSTLETRTALWPEGMDPAEEELAKRDWGSRFLEHVVGLPDDLRSELQFDAYTRINNSITNKLDSEKLHDMLVRTANNVRALGMERITQLHDEAGITNIDYHSAQPLELMCAVLDGDPAAIKLLNDGDVSVVFTNAKGDHNGAFRNVEDTYGTENNRTLFFEIKQPADFHRYMLMLNKRGIMPSTMVIGAHGHPGELPIHDVNGGLQLITNKGKPKLIDRLSVWRKSAQVSSARHEASTATDFAQIVRDFMQDSKGIDDDRDAEGRRRIILDACSSAQPVEVRRPGWRHRLRRITGTDHMESLGETLTKTADTPNLDVYANEKAFHSRRTKDKTGVEHYLDYVNEHGEVKKHVSLPATHYTLDRNGNVRSSRISHISMYRTSDEQFEEELRAA